jgi:hypothetical protein
MQLVAMGFQRVTWSDAGKMLGDSFSLEAMISLFFINCHDYFL